MYYAPCFPKVANVRHHIHRFLADSLPFAALLMLLLGGVSNGLAFPGATLHSPGKPDAEARASDSIPRPPQVAAEVAPPPSPGPADMVRITGGKFRMGNTIGGGSILEKPVHTVKLDDFYLGRYEVTFAEFDAFCTATGHPQPDDAGWGRGQQPVIHVTWVDAIDYCNWRSVQEGLTPVYTVSDTSVTANWDATGYRLPTEAEWEYAARGGGRRVRYGDGSQEANPARINFDASASEEQPHAVPGEFRRRTVPVGSLNAPNNLGLHDMSGNVWEWCWDRASTYQYRALTNPRGADYGDNRMKRGGAWNRFSSSVRTTYRLPASPIQGSNDLGFRLARGAG